MPDVFDVVPTKKGGATTSGSIYAAKYDNTLTVDHSELIFICAEVQHKGTGVKAKLGALHSRGQRRREGGRDRRLAPAQEDGDVRVGPSGEPRRKQHAEKSLPQRTTPPTHIGDVVAEMSFNDKAFAIPWQSQTIQTFSVDLPKELLYLSQTKQKYAVKLMKWAYINVPEGSPMYQVYNASGPRQDQGGNDQGLLRHDGPVECDSAKAQPTGSSGSEEPRGQNV